MNKFTYNTQHILELIERIAQEFHTEWNGDADAYVEYRALNKTADIIRSFKEEYEP